MRFLLLNFYESPENYHLEQILYKIFKKINIGCITIHSFKNSYLELTHIKNPYRFHISNIKLREIKDISHIISIDFPWKRDKSYIIYLKIIKEFKAAKIIFANHLCPDPGQSAFIDDSKKFGFLKFFEKLYILEYDDPRIWPGGSIIKKRRFAVDCGYYRPLKTSKKYDVLCFGSRSRNLNLLGSLISSYRIASLSIEKPQTEKIEYINLNKNLDYIRKIINQSRIVAAPVKEEEKNPACGNTALFLAMACGVAAVVRDTDYMRKYVTDGYNSFLYRTENELIEKIEKYLKNYNKLNKISHNARSTALSYASMEDIFSEIIEKEIL